MISGSGFRLLAMVGLLTGCGPLTFSDADYDGWENNRSVYGWSSSPGRGYGSGWGSSWGSGWGRPGWGGSPYGTSYDDNRYVRGGRRTVCDRGTQTCYRNGNIDASETRDTFGGRAGRRADDVRDRYGGDTYIRSRNVACDRGDRVCYKNGRPDRSDTRDVFGKKAARKIN